MHRNIKTCLQAMIVASAVFGATNLSAEERAPAKQDTTTSGQSKKGSGCKTVPKPLSPSGASVTQPEGESLQRKSWQPEGGEIQFTVKSFEQIPADASVIVCFRWKTVEEKKEEKKEETKEETKSDYVRAQISKIDLDSDRKTLKVTATVPTIGDTTDKVETAAIPFVPLAEVRILAIKSDVVSADATTTIGITHPTIALAFAAATVIFGCWVLYMIAYLRLSGQGGIQNANWLLQVISTPSGFASLSQLQIVLWTLVVAASAVYVMCLSGQLIQITNGTLVLLGIAGAAGLGAKAHSEAQGAAAESTAATAAREKAKAEALAAEKAAAAAAPAADPALAARIKAEGDAAAKEAAEKTALAAQAKKKADEIKNPPATQVPRWSDLIVNETVADDGAKSREVDVTRFQMLMFTLITATFVLMNVLTTYVIPEISTGFLTLMGISNGVYLGSKIIQRS